MEDSSHHSHKMVGASFGLGVRLRSRSNQASKLPCSLVGKGACQAAIAPLIKLVSGCALIYFTCFGLVGIIHKAFAVIT